MRKIIVMAAAALLVSLPASAKSNTTLINVVASCGTPNGAPYVVGQVRPVTQSTTGKICNG